MEIKRSCETRDIVAARIGTMIKGERLKFKNGEVKWIILNYTNDLEKHEQVLVFKDLFRHYEYENWPLKYNSTKIESEADIKICFVAQDGCVYLDKKKKLQCPFKMDDNTLAVAYAPYGGEWQGWVFINDSLFWSLRNDEAGKFQLFETLLHELGHTHNMDHSTKPKSIMYYKEEKNQVWDTECVELLFKLYKDDRLNALKKTESGKKLIAHSNSYAGQRAPGSKGQTQTILSILAIVFALISLLIYLLNK